MPQNCRQMIPLRSRSDSLTFTPGPHAIGIESNFSRCPIFESCASIAITSCLRRSRSRCRIDAHSVTRHTVSGEIDPQLRAKRVLRLKRVMMGALAEHRVERKIPPDGPAAWMIDHEVVRGLHCAQTPAHGTPKHKADARRQQFKRALDWAEAQEADRQPRNQ